MDQSIIKSTRVVPLCKTELLLLTPSVLFQMLTNLEEVFINCSLSPNISTEVPQGQEPEDYYDKRMVGNVSSADK